MRPSKRFILQSGINFSVQVSERRKWECVQDPNSTLDLNSNSWYLEKQTMKPSNCAKHAMWIYLWTLQNAICSYWIWVELYNELSSIWTMWGGKPKKSKTFCIHFFTGVSFGFLDPFVQTSLPCESQSTFWCWGSPCLLSSHWYHWWAAFWHPLPAWAPAGYPMAFL